MAGRHPNEIADEMEAIAKRGHNGDQETDHSRSAWREGSRHWWWA